MAEKALPVETVSRSGLAATYFDSTGGTPILRRLISGPLATDSYIAQNDGKTVLHVRNGADVANFTIETVSVIDGIALENRTVAVPADSERFIGPFPRNIYGDSFRFAIDDVSNVEVAVLRM